MVILFASQAFHFPVRVVDHYEALEPHLSALYKGDSE